MKWRFAVMLERKSVRMQVRDLPQDLWVEIPGEDVEKLTRDRGINVHLTVEEVSTHGGLRWDSVALGRGAGHIASRVVPGRL